MTDFSLPTAKQQPNEIAERMVDWFPHGSFTYDTYAKLKFEIARAIYNERTPSAFTPKTKSAPVVQAAHNSGEGDLAETRDYAGAGTGAVSFTPATLDWGQVVQILLRCMDTSPRGENSRDQAERMANELLASTGVGVDAEARAHAESYDQGYSDGAIAQSKSMDLLALEALTRIVGDWKEEPDWRALENCRRMARSVLKSRGAGASSFTPAERP